MQVLLGMLGLGAMRSAEKIKGAENNRGLVTFRQHWRWC